MKVHTRGGETALIGGKRQFKDDLRVWAYGAVDEAGGGLWVYPSSPLCVLTYWAEMNHTVMTRRK